MTFRCVKFAAVLSVVFPEDLEVVDKGQKRAGMIDLAIPSDINLRKKEYGDDVRCKVINDPCGDWSIWGWNG